MFTTLTDSCIAAMIDSNIYIANNHTAAKKYSMTVFGLFRRIKKFGYL
jgi:hypothetical protein